MILVVEGTKQSGKTTFINALEKLAKVPVFRLYDRDLLMFDVNQKDAQFASCLSYVNAAIKIDTVLEGNCIVVHDRLHLSELIYGKKVRKYENENMWYVDKKLADYGAKGLLFISDTTQERLGYDAYKEGFERLSEKSSIEWFKINLDKTNGMIPASYMLKIVQTMLEVKV